MTTTTKKPVPVAPAEEWRRRKGPHTVTLGTGQTAVFSLMSLRELLLQGLLPEELNEIAALDMLNRDQGGIAAVIHQQMLQAATDPAAAQRFEELIRKDWQAIKLAVTHGLHDPAVTLEQLDTGEFPFGDLEELAGLITGRRAFDSRGVRIGVEPIDVLATFPQEHNCPDGCEKCAAALKQLSSADLGSV